MNGNLDVVESLIEELYKIDALKFGNFILKSGIESPIYVDLRVVISYPALLLKLSEELWRISSGAEYSTVCGVPYTALPIATLISSSHNIPMLMRRKEAKDYGTKKMVEGIIVKGSKCLIVEDVVTSGSSVQETVDILTNHEVVVTDAVVLLDRQQGGKQNLEQNGVKLRPLMTLTQVVECLHKLDKIDKATVTKVKNFISDNSTISNSNLKDTSKSRKNITKTDSKDASPLVYGAPHELRGSYKKRADICQHPVSRRLLQIMESKETNLCLSADVESSVDLLEIVDLLGPYICMVKTHIDILEDFSPAVVRKLVKLAEDHNFLIFEDRKFADIGNTVKHQYTGGTFKISEWADITNAHSLPGPGLVEGLKAATRDRSDRACLLIAEMSSKENLATGAYTQATVAMAEEHSDFVIGFISTSKVSNNPTHIHFTPGIKLSSGNDNYGQQYLTPDVVIRERGCDVIIVGRGIVHSANRLEAALAFRNAGWSAYMSRLNESHS